MTEAMTDRLWCEGFDADLLAVVPGVDAALGPAADVELWTHSGTTNGRINCPNSWHTDNGLASFFSTTDRSPIPASYYTRDPLVRCTWLEVVRDEWVHGSIVVVNREPLWQAGRAMEELMYDLRGWKALDDEERREVQAGVVKSLIAASVRLLVLVAAVSGEGGNP